jgi:hypothetical protein
MLGRQPGDAGSIFASSIFCSPEDASFRTGGPVSMTKTPFQINLSYLYFGSYID